MNIQLTGNLIVDCKRALDANMSACAGVSNRLRALKAIKDAGAITADVFCKLAGQTPETLERDLEIAQADFQDAKIAYERFCANTGQPAYATWNED